jgi:hypothetical protein
MSAPIPNNPVILGLTYYCQGLFVESFAAGQKCGASPISLISSRGSTLTILP